MLVIPNNKIYDEADNNTISLLSRDTTIFAASPCYYNSYQWDREKDESEKINRASIHNGSLLGMISINNPWSLPSVGNMYIVSYVKLLPHNDNHKHLAYTVFVRDVLFMIDMLFKEYNKEYIQFSVITGTKQEKIYDKYIEKIGGRIIGTFHKSVRNSTGVIGDQKWYEIDANKYIKI